MTKQARNYSIKNDSMSYFPGEHMTGPPTDASGIYRGWNQTSPSNLLQGQCQRREWGEEAESQGEAGRAEGGTLITLHINDRALQQEKLATKLRLLSPARQ